MAGSRNMVMVQGFLAEKDIRQVDGKDVAYLSVFTIERWRDRQSGDPKEKVEHHNIVIFNEPFIEMAQHVKKGNQVTVQGQLESRKETVEGVERYFTEIVVRRFKGIFTATTARVDSALEVPNSLNHALVIGNLGRDPEIRQLQDGTKIAHLAIATETYLGRDVEPKTDWHRVVIFNPRFADLAEKMLLKGNQVCVEGQVQTREWTDQNGNPRKTTEIVLPKYRGEMTLLRNSNGGNGGQGGGYGGDRFGGSGQGQGGSPGGGFADLDDEIPF